MRATKKPDKPDNRPWAEKLIDEWRQEEAQYVADIKELELELLTLRSATERKMQHLRVVLEEVRIKLEEAYVACDPNEWRNQ